MRSSPWYVTARRPDAMLLLNCAGCRNSEIFTMCGVSELGEKDYARYGVVAWRTAANELR
jgi:hypothetical protein